MSDLTVKVEEFQNLDIRHFHVSGHLVDESVRGGGPNGGTRSEPFRFAPANISARTRAVIKSFYRAHDGIAAVGVKHGSVTIECEPDADWAAVQPAVLATICRLLGWNEHDIEVMFVFDGSDYISDPIELVRRRRILEDVYTALNGTFERVA